MPCMKWQFVSEDPTSSAMQWSNQLPAPEVLMAFISCSCSTNCSLGAASVKAMDVSSALMLLGAPRSCRL